MTQAAFAQREGINYTTFCSWVQQRHREGRAKAAAKVRFAEMQVPVTPGGAGGGSATDRRDGDPRSERPESSRGGTGAAGLTRNARVSSLGAVLRRVGAGGGYAQAVRRLVGRRAEAVAGGSETRSGVLLHESGAHASETTGLGRHRGVGAGEAPQAGSFSRPVPGDERRKPT